MEVYRNPIRGGKGPIGVEAPEYWLIEIDGGVYDLFTEYDRRRPRKSYIREGQPKPKEPSRAALHSHIAALEAEVRRLHDLAVARADKIKELKLANQELQKRFNQQNKRVALLEQQLSAQHLPFWRRWFPWQ